MNHNKKQVLIITFYFNQTTDIGSQRLRGLAKYLPEFGWRPIILTVKSNSESDLNVDVVETPYQSIQTIWKKRFKLNPNVTVKEQKGDPIQKDKKTFIDYLLHIFDEIFTYPNFDKNWYYSAIDDGKKIFKSNKIDAIISSSFPPECHFIARKFKDIYQVPWVADFRDLWTQNQYYSHSSIRRLTERKLEINTLAAADALVATTPYSAEELRQLHKKKTYNITNGFDPEIDTITPIFKDKFTLTYTGTLYKGKHDPIRLFEAMNELISERSINVNDVEFRFFGEKGDWLEKEIKLFNFEHIVKIHGFVDRNTALKKQRESQLLLILLGDSEKIKNTAPAKIYEYLAARRPILAIGKYEGFVKEILDETNAGIFAISKDEIKNYLLNAYQDWKITGQVSSHGNEQKINNYTQREMAKKFSVLLNDILK